VTPFGTEYNRYGCLPALQISFPFTRSCAAAQAVPVQVGAIRAFERMEGVPPSKPPGSDVAWEEERVPTGYAPERWPPPLNLTRLGGITAEGGSLSLRARRGGREGADCGTVTPSQPQRPSQRHPLLLQARCAGVCYPRQADACLDYFRSFFAALGREEGLAPWEPEAEAALPPPRVLLTPHIDFRVSGRAYGHAFAPWVRRPAEADCYVILGVGHRASLPWSLDGRDYATPLGIVPSAAGAILEIVERSGFPLGEAPAHEGEHSIEFPLVLLQALRLLRGIERPFSFIPILCGGMFPEVAAGKPPAPGAAVDRLAEALRAVLGRLGPGRGVQVIVSIDGCHVGPRFDHPYRVGRQRLRACAAWEETLWQTVERGDLPAFFAHLGEDQNARYFDGVGALTLMMKLFGKDLALKRTHYEQWHTPSDASAVTFTSGWAE